MTTPNDQAPPATTQTPAGETTPPTTPPATPPAGDPPLSNAEAAELRKLRKQAKEWEDAEKARKEAEMTEIQKREARIKELEAANTETMRKAIGAEAGLPRELWGRIHGSTEEELRADAEALKALVKPSQPQQPATTGNPPGQTTPPAASSHKAEWQRLRATDPTAAQQYYVKHRADILRE